MWSSSKYSKNFSKPNISIIQKTWKRWSVLAYINLFIMHLKSKLRKRHHSISSERSTASLVVAAVDSAMASSTNALNAMKRNNWMPTNEDRRQSTLSSTGTVINNNYGFNAANGARNSMTGLSRISTTAAAPSGVDKASLLCGKCFKSSPLSVDRLKNVLKFKRASAAVSSINIEPSQTTASVANYMNEIPVEVHTSMTRQLAFGPWVDESQTNVISGCFRRITLAQVTTFTLIIICIVIVCVIYSKEQEMMSRWNHVFVDNKEQDTILTDNINYTKPNITSEIE